jgi:membrane protein
MRKLNVIKDLLVETFIEFSKERPFLHGAALSYYALMALVPLLYLSITFFGGFVGHDTMLEIIATLLKEYIGIQDISGIIEFLDQVDLGAGSLTLKVLGIGALLFSCTAILNSLKKSINEFYDVDNRLLNRKKRIVKGVIFRGVSMVVIVGLTTLVIALYFAETIFLSLGNRFFEDAELLNWLFSAIARHGIPITLNLIIFSFLFKYLHDGVVTWRVAIRGGVVTGILLYLGQLLIKIYLMNYFFAASGGVAGTMLIILVWVYYSSQILFLGAKFTAVYAKFKGTPIMLRD